MMHTFGTDINGGLVFERPTTADGTHDTAAPARPPAGTVILARNANDSTALVPPSFTTLAGGRWTYSVDNDATTLQIQVSEDNGVTWSGALTSAESTAAALTAGDNATSAVSIATAAQLTANDALSLSQSTGARSVNGKTPDAAGAVTLVPSDIGALSATGPLAAANVTGLAVVATSGNFTDLSNRPPVAIPLDQKGAANGVAALNPAGQVLDGSGTPLLSASQAVSKDELVLNAKDHGIVGNGSDESVAIAALFGAARTAAAQGPANVTVRFEPGRTYTIGPASEVDPSGCRVLAHNVTFKAQAGVNAVNIFLARGPFSWEGGTIDGNKANNTDPGNDTNGCGIYVYSAAGWASPASLSIRGLKIINCQRGGLRISVGTTETDPALISGSNAVLDNVVVTGCQIGLYAARVADLRVSNSIFNGNSASGINAVLVNGLSVTGCTTDKNSVGNTVNHGMVALYSRTVRVVGHRANGNGGTGICFGGGSTTNTPSSLVTVTGSACDGNGLHGISLDLTKTGSGSTCFPIYGAIQGNVCSTNAMYGVYITNTSHVDVSGNVATANKYGGVAVSSTYVTMDGNHCVNNGGVGAGYGIMMYGNATFPSYGHHRLGMNMVTPNVVGGYYVESTYVADVVWSATTTTNPQP